MSGDGQPHAPAYQPVSVSSPTSSNYSSPHSSRSASKFNSRMSSGVSASAIQVADPSDVDFVDADAHRNGDRGNKHSEQIEQAEIEIPIEDGRNGKFSWKKLWAYAGPGWLMSIAYLDPGNLESDLQAGAIAGYGLIWVLFWATVMGFLFQTLAVRLGVVTGLDLAQLCRQQYPRPVAYVVWIMTEIAIVGSDIQEVVGSAIAMHILFGLPLWAGVLITALDTFTFLLLHYFGIRKLEALFAALIAIMAACFAVMFGIGGPDMGALFKGWAVPSVPNHSATQAVGMLGAVIMPHNIFLHSALVLSRNVNRKSKSHMKEANFYFMIEGGISLAVSFIINLCVVAVFARGFYEGHCKGDECEKRCGSGSDAIGLQQAGCRLGIRFGDSVKYIWAVGLLAAGQSSTMTGTFAGQYVMQGFLDLKIAPWLRTALTRGCALGPALLVALSAHRKLDSLDEYLNVLQSIQLPFALVPVLLFNCDHNIMGRHFKLGGKRKWFLIALVVMVVVTNFYLVVGFTHDNLAHTTTTYVLMGLFGLCYVVFLGYLVLRETQWYATNCLRGGSLRRPSQQLLSGYDYCDGTSEEEEDDNDAARPGDVDVIRSDNGKPTVPSAQSEEQSAQTDGAYGSC